MSILINILSFLVVFTFIVVIHELGHYLFAELFGVKVHEFAIGFGPELYRKKGKKTDFRINVFPLGGYVRLKGEDPSEEEEPDSLYGISAWKRFLIVFAGPLFSILAGYLLFIFILSVWGYTPIVIDKVIENSPAQEAGLKDKDIILKINNKYIFDTVDMTSIIRQGKTITVEVLRDNRKIEISVTPRLSKEQYYILMKDVTGEFGGKLETINNIKFSEYMKSYKKEYVTIKSDHGSLKGVIDNVTILPERYTIGIYYGQFSNTFAKDVGIFQKKDKILEVQGIKITSGNDLLDIVTGLNLKDDEMYIKVDGDFVESVIKPFPNELSVTIEKGTGEIVQTTIEKGDLLKVLSTPGVLEQPVEKLKPKGLQGISVAIARSNRLALYIWKTLPGIFFGRNLQEVTGPVGMVQVIGQAAQMGFEVILTIVAIITINLGIFNLFPLPALDGGRIIFALIEMITRRKINKNVENIIHTIGFFFLIGLVFFVTFIDITRIFTR
ncbi:MAG: site-2 protease family protein [Fervidobacterium sp.]